MRGREYHPNKGKSKANDVEANKVVSVIIGLLEGGDVTGHGIVVLTSYIAQNTLIQKMIEAEYKSRKHSTKVRRVGT